MFPSWSRKLLIRTMILASVCLVILGGVWAARDSLGQNQAGTANQAPGDPTTNANAPAAEQNKPAAPVSVEQNKPAAEPANPAPPESRPLSLVGAITLVEQSGKGLVVKAEREGDGADVQFTVETLGKDGARSRFKVNAAGKVDVENAQPASASTTNKPRERGRERGGKERERERERKGKEKERPINE